MYIEFSIALYRDSVATPEPISLADGLVSGYPFSIARERASTSLEMGRREDLRDFGMPSRESATTNSMSFAFCLEVSCNIPPSGLLECISTLSVISLTDHSMALRCSLLYPLTHDRIQSMTLSTTIFCSWALVNARTGTCVLVRKFDSPYSEGENECAQLELRNKRRRYGLLGKIVVNSIPTRLR